ncbi:MAG: hypothetical protein M3Z00_12830 [Actinomycetota bacterium]|nr:hypothetical protein [Actinomycetota bacterium]
MLLILCSLDDLDTVAFARGASAAGVPCRVLTAEALSFASRRSHRLSSIRRAGRTSISVVTEIETVGAPLLLEGNLSGVLNRLVEPPATAWRRAAAVERDYAAAELFAFTLSWLSGLTCPVRNRPTPGCLAGPTPHSLSSLAVARQVGLDCPPLRYSSRAGSAATDLGSAALAAAGHDAGVEQLVCLDGKVLTRRAPAGLADAVAAFASAIGAEQSLNGVDFAVSGSRWVFAGMTPLPALAGGAVSDGAVSDGAVSDGQHVADAVLTALAGRRTQVA